MVVLKVGNLRNVKVTEPYDVRIDRRHSVLCNPFKMSVDSVAERNRVCDEYERYFTEKIARETGDAEFRKEVYRLYCIAEQYKTLRVLCWCAPERCHGETILLFIAKMLRRAGYSVSIEL